MEDIDASLLEKYAKGKCNSSEQKLVEQWLADEQFPDGVKIQNEAVQKEIYSAIEARLKPVQKKIGIKRLMYGSIAASLILTSGFFFFNPKNDNTQNIVFNAPFGQPSTITLPDSSKVELQPGSKISYPSQFVGNTRNVSLLSGEAFFIIQHHPNQPFILNSANSKIKVLGTRFNVRNLKSALMLQVTLTQGKISFQAKKGVLSTLKPGESLTFDKINQHLLNIVKVDTNVVTAWKTGIIRFNDTPMPEVLETLENRYGFKFKINCNLDKPISGKFGTQPISRVLQLMEQASGYRFKNSGKYIEVYK
jgi:transmembrane sensor